MATTNKNAQQLEQSVPHKLVTPAAEGNKQVILEVLLNDIIPVSTPVDIIEIGSGSGQHVIHFASHFPLATFQPSDTDQAYLSSIRAYIAEYAVNALTNNVLAPLTIDLLSPIDIPEQSFDFVYSSNLIHITPIACTHALFALADHVLKSGGSLITYGPYGLSGGGRITPESNRRFHAYLQTQDARWGLKGIDELAAIAREHSLTLKRTFDMPCNNTVLWWIKTKHE